jgi:hypothetical protein
METIVSTSNLILSISYTIFATPMIITVNGKLYVARGVGLQFGYVRAWGEISPVYPASSRC